MIRAKILLFQKVLQISIYLYELKKNIYVVCVCVRMPVLLCMNMSLEWSEPDASIIFALMFCC